MRVINAVSVSQGYSEGLNLLAGWGLEKQARDGNMVELPEPVTTVFENPRRRVLAHAGRHANPFFHLMESMWMLAGRMDLAWLAQFNAGMAEYSVDVNGMRIIPGAYGQRWRHAWGFDQLKYLVDLLKNHPQTQRAWLGIGHPKLDRDPQQKSPAVPCNLTVHFLIRRENELDMTVFNRSNDIVHGLFGANVVHFSYLLEYMAARLGLEIGTYYHVSSSFHAYDWPGPLQDWGSLAFADHHAYGDLECGDLFYRDVREGHFDKYLHDWLRGSENYQPSRWLTGVCEPMRMAWFAHKDRDYDRALSLAAGVRDQAWAEGAKLWLRTTRDKWLRRSKPQTSTDEAVA